MHFCGEPPSVGKQTDLFQNHVTFLAFANVESTSEAEFVDRITRSGKQIHRFTLEPSSVEFFGPQKNIKVQTFKQSDKAQNLHDKLVDTSVSLEVKLDRLEYSGEYFHPHLTIYKESYIPASVLVDSLTVVRHVGGYGSPQVEVVANFSLA